MLLADLDLLRIPRAPFSAVTKLIGEGFVGRVVKEKGKMIWKNGEVPSFHALEPLLVHTYKLWFSGIGLLSVE
jgi:hypothetical protein